MPATVNLRIQKCLLGAAITRRRRKTKAPGARRVDGNGMEVRGRPCPVLRVRMRAGPGAVRRLTASTLSDHRGL